LAIYAADIQINVKNKGDLRTLESRFKKIETAAVSLSKTLKGLGRRNAIKVDTRAAMSAISALEARIRGLNRTVNLDARSSASGGGGMSGAAIPLAAAALAGGGRSTSTGRGGSILSRRRQELAGTVDTAKMAKLAELEKKIATAMEKQARSAEKLTKATAAKDSRKQQIDELDAQWENLSKVITGKKRKSRFGSREINVLEGQRDAVDKLRKSLMSEKIEKINAEHAAKQLNDERKKALKILEDEQEIIRSGSKKKLESLKLTDEQKTVQGELNKLQVKAGELESKLLQKKDAITQAEARQQKAKNVLAQTQGRINKGLNVNADTLRRQKGELDSANKSLAANNRWYQKWENELRGVGKQIDSVTEKQRLLNSTTAKMPAGGLMGQLRGGFKDIGGMKGAMGAAGKGALASAALIPGVAPLAVGGFAGAAGAKTAGAAAVGGGIGVAVAAAVQGTVALVEFARASAQVAAEMDRMRVALSGVVPDQESYNTSLEKVSKLSNKYAISQRTILKGFTQLQASADAAGFTVEDTGKLMEGLLARTLASGKGIEEFKGVMLAASQILSKGKLQAEEARGQIGERIPGFMADLANSMGISMQQLDKAMEQGEVTLKDFFKLGEDLLKNNEKIAVQMANSYANAGMRLDKSIEDLQMAMGARSMIIGAKFQEGLKVVVDIVAEIVKALNRWRIAELKLTIAIGKRMQWLAGKGKEAPNPYLAKDIEELRILTGEQEILTKAKKEQFETEIKGAAQTAANFKKIEDRLKIDIKYQENRIALGEKEAEILREIAEVQLQFEGRDISDIEEKIRTLKDLEDQTVSNKVAFMELQQEAAQRLKDLQNPVEQLRNITAAFEDGFSNAVREVVKGTKSIGDAIASMLNRIADAMIQNAADMAAAAASNALMKFLANAFLSNIGGDVINPSAGTTTGMSTSQIVAQDNTFYGNSFPKGSFASGGYVDRPTNALIGEGGEGEYVIPESKLASSLSRFQAGHRGNSVVPGGVGNSGGSGGGSGEVTVNYTGPTLNFNGDEYVPRSAVPQIINSAAMAGATAGRANTMKDLKNSRSQRSRLGL
jgi:tape measure domain-containing protein